MARPESGPRLFSKRDILLLLGGAGVSAAVAGFLAKQELSSRRKLFFPKPPLPKPVEKPPPSTAAPTVQSARKESSPAAIKEKENPILWIKELLVPPKSPSGKEPKSFFTSDDRLFLATPDGYPASFNLAKGEKLWQHEDKGIVYGAEPKTVYIVRYDDRLCALDIQKGQKIWKSESWSEWDVKADCPLWITQKSVFLPFFFSGPTIGEIDKKSGYFIREQICCTEIIGQIDNIFIIESYRNGSYELGAYDLDSNKVLWSSEIIGMEKPKFKILALSPKRLYFFSQISEEKGLGVVDPYTGKHAWPPMLPSQLENYPESHFVGEMEEITILSIKRWDSTYGLEASTGKQIWENDDLVLDHLVGTSKNTLIGIRDNPSFLYGFDPKTGQRKWRLELPQSTAQRVIFHDKLIYGSGQTLAVLDPETGKLVSSVPVSGEPTRLFPQKDFLLVQTGKSGSRGSLLAIKI